MNNMPNARILICREWGMEIGHSNTVAVSSLVFVIYPWIYTMQLNRNICAPFGHLAALKLRMPNTPTIETHTTPHISCTISIFFFSIQRNAAEFNGTIA